MHDVFVVTAAAKGSTGIIGLTKHTSVDLASKTLDALALLVDAPEVVSPY